jgi:hypothetical protein
MRVLLDHCCPMGLRNHLPQHEVTTAYFLGWQALKNGELLNAAESSGFEVFLTADQSIRYQQNLAARNIAIVLLVPQDWPIVKKHLQEISALVAECKPRDFHVMRMM